MGILGIVAQENIMGANNRSVVKKKRVMGCPHQDKIMVKLNIEDTITLEINDPKVF
jgi:hypothetical protein